MYAPRQRGVEPASTNRSSHTFILHRIGSVTRERVRTQTGLHVYYGLGHTDRYWYHNGSIPLIGITAATAARFLPYPSRTRKISSPALRSVLEWATLWEIRFAATIHTHNPTEPLHCSGPVGFSAYIPLLPVAKLNSVPIYEPSRRYRAIEPESDTDNGSVTLPPDVESFSSDSLTTFSNSQC